MTWFFGRQSKPEEQGGFCDRDSEIHYCNESKEETLNQAAVFDEREEGSSIQMQDDSDPKRSDDSTRFNTTVLESDAVGFEYPSRYRPGK